MMFYFRMRLSGMLLSLVALAALCVLLPVVSLAGEASTPVAGQSMSLHAARSLAVANRQPSAAPPKFYPLAKNRAALVPARRLAAAQPVVVGGDIVSEAQLPTVSAGASAMTRERAHQILSLFSGAD